MWGGVWGGGQDSGCGALKDLRTNGAEYLLPSSKKLVGFAARASQDRAFYNARLSHPRACLPEKVTLQNSRRIHRTYSRVCEVRRCRVGSHWSEGVYDFLPQGPVGGSKPAETAGVSRRTVTVAAGGTAYVYGSMHGEALAKSNIRSVRDLRKIALMVVVRVEYARNSRNK